jgi:serine/threonine protein kinase
MRPPTAANPHPGLWATPGGVNVQEVELPEEFGSTDADLAELVAAKELLGKGGMAEVYAAVHKEDGRQLALKRIAPSLAGRSHIRRRFANEIDLLYRCRGPYVLELIAGGTFHDTPAYVCERCVGSLYDLARDRPLPLDRVLAYAAEVLVALDRVHAAGAIHRDIKPSNVLIAADGSIRLADFGIARHPVKRLTTLGRSVGTPSYTAPDLAADPSTAAPAHDLFSVGLLVLTVSSHLRTSMLTDPKHREATLARFPKATAHLLDRATSPDPRQRYTWAAEMAVEVQLALTALQ